MAATATQHYPSTRIGGQAFSHAASSTTENEYDRLRSLARSAHSQHNPTQSAAYNKQASDLIFRANNAPGRVGADTIDLHGQYVEEAEAIVEARIRYAQSTGQRELHIIVGKGNHSVGHVQKLKPAVERVCAELGVGFWTEENEGRLFVDLAGTGMGPGQGHGGVGGGGWQQQGYRPPQGQQHGGQQHGGQQHGGQQHGGQQHGGQHNQNQELERLARRFLPRLLRKLEQNCCVVM